MHLLHDFLETAGKEETHFDFFPFTTFNMTTLMNFYPNRVFLFGDILCFKFLISSESLERASFVGFFKKSWRNFIDEFTVDNLVLDIEVIALSVLFGLGERAVGDQIEQLIAPTVERRTIRFVFQCFVIM